MGLGFHLSFAKAGSRNSDGESSIPHRVPSFPLFEGFVTSLLLCHLADRFIQRRMQASSSILIVFVGRILHDI